MDGGGTFPALTLPALEGGECRLDETWQGGPVLVLVGYRDCKTTRQTLPYVDRIHRRCAESASVTAVLQDDAPTARALVAEAALALPVLLDPPPYPLVRALALDAVPQLFLLAAGGRIEAVSVGFRRADLERFAQRLGVAGQLFETADAAPFFRPG